MSLLSNGLELLELGVTAWREIINANFSKLYTKAEVDEHITAALSNIRPTAKQSTAVAISVAAATWTKINFEISNFDLTSSFSNSRFVAPLAGYYSVSSAIRVQSSTGFSVAIYKNGAIFSFIPAYYPELKSFCAFVSDAIYLNAGDYVEIYVSTLVSTTLNGNSSNNFITIFLIQES